MVRQKFIFFVIAVFGLCQPSLAQQAGVPNPSGTGFVAERLIDVTVQYSIAIPAKGDGWNSASEALESGRAMIYAIAGSECAVLQKTLASSCRLDRLNVQSSHNRHSSAQELITISGNASYKVGVK